jgi:hypothetical protein
MFKLINIFFLGLLATVLSENSTVVQSFTCKSCGLKTDIAQNIVMSVNPAIPQTDYLFDLGADFSKDVNGGTSKYSVTYNFIPLSPTINDLCGEINNSNITCPLKIGNIGIQSKGTVPSGLSGTTTIKNEWFNLENERILCLMFTIKT